LLKPGIRQLEEITGKSCLGVVPYITNLDLDQEDSIGLETLGTTSTEAWQPDSNPNRQLRIAVISLPYLSNFTDFDALRSEPSVSLRFVKEPRTLNYADLIVLPGSKNSLLDLSWLNATGIAGLIQRHARSGPVFGICGGMQMMGMSISDPFEMESGGQGDG